MEFPTYRVISSDGKKIGQIIQNPAVVPMQQLKLSELYNDDNFLFRMHFGLFFRIVSTGELMDIGQTYMFASIYFGWEKHNHSSRLAGSKRPDEEYSASATGLTSLEDVTDWLYGCTEPAEQNLSSLTKKDDTAINLAIAIILSKLTELPETLEVLEDDRRDYLYDSIKPAVFPLPIPTTHFRRITLA